MTTRQLDLPQELSLVVGPTGNESHLSFAGQMLPVESFEIRVEVGSYTICDARLWFLNGKAQRVRFMAVGRAEELPS